MAANCLFGRPYYVYPNSVGRLFLDTIFVWCLLVMKCACEWVKSGGRINLDSVLADLLSQRL